MNVQLFLVDYTCLSDVFVHFDSDEDAVVLKRLFAHLKAANQSVCSLFTAGRSELRS